tara:strand:+ start:569 stop:2041 length:1473 start_codon:yes stop_codon:yes gene_type:complete
MNNNLVSLLSFIPELIIIIGLLSVILLEIIPGARRWIFHTVVGSIIFAFLYMMFNPAENGTLFMNLIVVDPFSTFFKIIFLVSTLVAVLISDSSVEIKDDIKAEYYFLILVILLGLFLMSSSINLLMIYLAVELVSIPSYILAGISKNNKSSNEAALKYVIFGSFASGLMLFGLSWLYGLAGSTNIYIVYDALLNSGNELMLFMSLLFILVGFGYKISMAPFHYWTPDVYEGAATPVTTFFSVAPKAAGLSLLIRFFYTVFANESGFSASSELLDVNWTFIIAVLSALTMTIGNVLALYQENVKRMLAYSSISHIGFILIGFCVLSHEALTSMMFYMFIYLFMNLGAFTVAVFVKNKTNGDNVDDWNGIASKAPLISAFMVIALVSLAGLPPTSGFVAKFYVLAELFRMDSYRWLAIVAILNSVISLYYYFRIVKAMYFIESSKDSPQEIETELSDKFIIVGLCAQPILFYFYWSPLLDFIQSSLSIWVP